jgi:glycosidase
MSRSGAARSARRMFHVARGARARYGIDRALADRRGDLVATDRPAMRRLAGRMNAARPAGTASIQAGDLTALGLLHEIFHLLIERYENDAVPDAMAQAVATLGDRLGRDADSVLDRFAIEFPVEAAEPESPEECLEELLLVRIANENPAAARMRELFDDRPLATMAAYTTVLAELESVFAGWPAIGPDGETLLELLRAPARRAPGTLAGQLRYIRDRWGSLLGDALAHLIGEIDLALGVLAEEERALHLRFGGGGGPGRVDAPSFVGQAAEAERFSADSAWMPRLVLMAKSTYVWLDQLSRAFGRDIRTLDAVPDEELDRLARMGVTGLWLIGLWERSKASERIKRMRGNADAVASAYSLDDYRIADDLGGEDACANLRHRAWNRGIRLASDMVPNHMGIDSRWVMEHPDWFLSLHEPPYPSYTFSGPDLSSDDRAGVVLEDHYWDDSDAAVVFKRFDRSSGDIRYVYHGNDGTSFPWNDTAQLDFLRAEVREAVIATILDVARRFPVIRFDAAMVLAKRHIRRLWWPQPGAGDGIPSRAEHAMSQAAFDRLMPTEFWRDVVDRVAAEVPDTLLLAEAFWMLEGYFVRTLGMHRVYNSAFMHMLRDEDNAGYRRVMKETLEFDPQILKRYVNFMNNPDEETAVAQFGKGDKYIGVATLLATLPGLPMLGHGQVEGFAEKYGMEFRRATLDERPDPWLVDRHEREIFPLLHRRAWFAEADHFLLYDLRTDAGVDEHVFAYSNGSGPTRSLVIYHNRFASTSGTIRDAEAYAVKADDGTRRLVRRSFADGLGLPAGVDDFVAFHDGRSGLEYLRSCAELHERGLWLSLDAYRSHVFWEFRELRDGSTGQWRRLAERLGGRGVPSLEDALREQQLEPVHEPLVAMFRDGFAARIIEPGRALGADLDGLERRFAAFLDAVAHATGLTGATGETDAGDAGVASPVVAADARARIARAFAATGSASALEHHERAALLAWLLLARTGELAPGADVAATSRAWFDELRFAPVLARGLREAGLDEGAAWAITDLVRVLLELPRPSALGGSATTLPARLLDAWLANDDIRTAMGVNTWEGSLWLDRDRFAALVAWAERLDAIDGRRTTPRRLVRPVAERLLPAAADAGYRVDRLREAVAPAPRPRAPARPATPSRRRATRGS